MKNIKLHFEIKDIRNKNVISYIFHLKMWLKPLFPGTWSSNAAKEAAKYGKINRIVPDPKTGLLPDSLGTDPKAAYLFYCDNETIEGEKFA